MGLTVQARMDEVEAAELRRLAEADDRSVSGYVAKVLREHLRERLGPLPPHDEQAA